MYTALQAFRRRGLTFSPGDELPPKARMWPDLRYLQRKGLVSWEANRVDGMAERSAAMAKKPRNRPSAEVPTETAPAEKRKAAAAKKKGAKKTTKKKGGRR